MKFLSPLGLAALLAGAGVTHFLRPRPYDAIVPSRLPGKPRTWTYVSGLAGPLAPARSRRAAPLATHPTALTRTHALPPVADS